LALIILPQPAWGQANVQGQWATLPTQMPINPVHVAMMHNGKVLIVSGSGNVAANTSYMAGVWDPATDTVTTQSVAWDMFCNGMVVLPDGRPFIMSGTLQYDPFHGQLRTSAYDPATGNFVDLQPMAHGRWYPTATTLGNGNVMIFSGLDENGNTNTTVEIYQVGVGWSQPFSAPWTPPLYPRMHLLPKRQCFLFRIHYQFRHLQSLNPRLDHRSSHHELQRNPDLRLFRIAAADSRKRLRSSCHNHGRGQSCDLHHGDHRPRFQ
jgi:hypothetical protein